MLQHARRWLRLSISFLIAAACADAHVSAPSELLVASTDRAEYARTAGPATVTVRLFNRGTHSVEIVGCPEPLALQIERRDGASWTPQASFNWICSAIHLQTTRRLEPGEEITGQVQLESTGEFRARVFIGPPAFDGPNVSVTTPTFTVR
jgi:hypothetical protein